MNTYLYNLFHKFSWYEILPHLLSDEFNAEQLLDVYQSAYLEILTIPFIPDSGLTLIFESEFDNTLIPLCIDTHNNINVIPPSWSSWLSLRVDPSVLKTHRGEYIVVLCLYTMTLSGFSQKEIKEMCVSSQN